MVAFSRFQTATLVRPLGEASSRLAKSRRRQRGLLEVAAAGPQRRRPTRGHAVGVGGFGREPRLAPVLCSPESGSTYGLLVFSARCIFRLWSQEAITYCWRPRLEMGPKKNKKGPAGREERRSRIHHPPIPTLGARSNPRGNISPWV